MPRDSSVYNEKLRIGLAASNGLESKSDFLETSIIFKIVTKVSFMVKSIEPTVIEIIELVSEETEEETETALDLLNLNQGRVKLN